MKQLPAEALLAEVADVARSAPACVEVRTFPEQMEEDEVHPVLARVRGVAARFEASVPAPRRTASFTALHAGIELDAPDHDAFVRTNVESIEQTEEHDPIFAFPRGANAGSCLHAVFEQVMQHPGSVASIARSTLETWAGLALSAHGLPERWRPVAVDLIAQTLNAPLQRDDPFTLAKVDAGRRLSELEFHFALARGAARPWALLEQAVRIHRAERGLPATTAGLMQSRAAAFMKGFVDLIFERDGRYAIVDYKSNWLGSSLAHYGSTALDEAIAAEHYDLQYLLYTLAVDRWLASRLPNYDYPKHFDGVYYLFVRGMRAAGPAGHGVYFARPSIATMQVLRQVGGALEGA